MPTTKATLHLSKAFMDAVAPSGGGGSWVYLYDNKPPQDGNWTTSKVQTDGSAFAPLVLQGQKVTTGSGPVLTPDPDVPGGYIVSVDLTTATTPAVSGGHLFLIVQSEDVATHTDLTQKITAEGLLLTHSGSGAYDINGAWNYGYTGFEYALANAPGDQGDITYIPGFGPHLAVQINYTDGTSDSRGLKYSATQTIAAAEATLKQWLPPSTPATSSASTVSGTTLTIGGTVTGKFKPGDVLSGKGIPDATFIVASGTGTGGTGTYTINKSLTISAAEEIDTVASAVIYYPGGVLAGAAEVLVGPSNNVYGSTVGSGYTQTFGVYNNSDWSSYLAQVGAIATPSSNSLRISANVAGVADASHIWHNGSYGSFNVNLVTLEANPQTKDNPNGWGEAGKYWLFSPATGSQTKGYMLISNSNVQANLYAPGQGGALAQLWGFADLTQPNAGLAQPFILPGSSAPPGSPPGSNYFNVSGNNEFGNVFTKFFIGFSAGNLAAIDNQANPANRGGGASGSPTNLASQVDLSNSNNWNPQYQFDGQFTAGSAPLRVNEIPTTQHFDPYAFSFYQNANAYSSAFTDGIFGGINPGPQINLSNSSSAPTDKQQNVANIDLYAYAPDEVDGKFVTPSAPNFIAPSSSNKYLSPTTADGSNLILQLQPFNNAITLRPDAKVQLGIFDKLDGGNATFKYVTLPTNGNLAQNFTIDGSPSTGWTATASGANGAGFLQVSNLPLPSSANAGDIYWYQLVVSDKNGGNQKVFDLYGTAAAQLGQLQAYNSATAANKAPVLAATDGNALLITAGPVGSQFTFSLQPDLSLNSELIQLGPNPNAPLNGTIITAPVAGNFSYDAKGTPTFHAIDGQDGTGIAAAIHYSDIAIVNPAATSSSSSISGTTLTVGGTVGGGKFAPGDVLVGAGIPAGTFITAVGSGASGGIGGAGTYTINKSLTISPQEIDTLPWSNPSPSIAIDKGLPVLGFGWTGTNNGLHINAPTQPVFKDPSSTNPQWVVDGQVSQFTNKLSAGDIGLVSFFKADGTPVGFGDLNVAGVADLDGQWTTKGVAYLGNGTFQAKVQEMLPDGTAPLPGAPVSAPLAITINMSKLAVAPTSAGDGIKFDAGSAAGNWLRLEQSSTPSKLPAGATIALYATDSSGNMLDRTTGLVTTSLDNATLAKIGSLQDDKGQEIVKTGQSIYLQATQQLKFAVYNSDGTIGMSPSVAVSTPTADGSLKVNVAGLELSAATNKTSAGDNTLTDQAYLSSTQHTTNLPLTYFKQGQSVTLDLAGSGSDLGVVSFARVDVNPTTGAMSIGGVAYGTKEFSLAAAFAADSRLMGTFGGGVPPSQVAGTVSTGSGYYAPVTISWDAKVSSFNIFTIGTANNADGREHVRVFGENTFGIEDRLVSQGADFDYNDLIIGINVHS